MAGFDDIEYEYGKHAFVWVKPVEGLNWDDIYRTHHKSRDTGWRPAKLVGHCFEDAHRGTPMDGRRIELIGVPHTYMLTEFEFGGVLEYEESLAPRP